MPLSLPDRAAFLCFKKECFAEGEKFLADLLTKLFAAGRTSDAELAAKDEEARKKFYKEFWMIE